MKKLIGLILIIFSTLPAQALSIQGVLRNTDGSTVSDGARNFDFLLYEATSGGSAVWCETQTLTVTNGVYSATLGDENNGSCTNDELSDLNFGVQYFLGISIDGAAELSPRTKLTLSPYAILAQVSGQDNIFPQSGSVGVGTENPAGKFHVENDGGGAEGGIIIDADVSSTYTAKIEAKDTGLEFSTNADDRGFVFNTGATSDPKVTITHDGNVGIGTDDPQYKLDINGSAKILDYLEIDGNHYVLNLVGSENTYIQWYPDGKDAGRKGWTGWGSETTDHFTIANEISGGNIRIVPTGEGKIELKKDVIATNIPYVVAKAESDDFNSTAITLTNLDLSTHKKYKVIFNLYGNAGGVDHWAGIWFNTSVSQGDYHGQAWIDWDGGGADDIGSSSYLRMLRNGWSQSGRFHGEFIISKYGTSYPVVTGSAGFLGTNAASANFSGQWHSNANITSMTFTSGHNSSLWTDGDVVIYAMPY